MTAVSLCYACCSSADKPDAENHVLMLRFRSHATYSDEYWGKTYDAIKDYPGCCDEVWFSSGIGFPPLETHH